MLAQGLAAREGQSMPRIDNSQGGDSLAAREFKGVAESCAPSGRAVRRVAVFGLGYVGSVTAACLASRGHSVIGVDVRREKVDMINRGQSPVVEGGLGELIFGEVAAGRLSATTNPADAVANTDIALVCVGTPSAANGSLLTTYLERVSEDIGAALAGRAGRYTVVIRSTVLPWTCEQIVLPRLQAASGLRAGEDFGVAVNPEFLREGSSIRDFFEPPKIVIGQFDAVSGDVVAQLYEGMSAPVFRVPLAVAEMVKYADNGFHALKTGFANEIGAVCKAMGLDSHAVMDIFVADTKLNISRAYLRPGFAFGGSCLPKDLRALIHRARTSDVPLPILESVCISNNGQIDRAFNVIEATGKRRVGLLGLAFKSGTDDLRESPLVALAERLVGRGFDLQIYDPQVSASRLLGANRAFAEARIPCLSQCVSDSPDEVVNHAEVCVVGAADPESIAALRRVDGRIVVDLVRFPGSVDYQDDPRYIGISW
ncbi:nucleotide sugar dehydrogenase [Mycolicibacterium smegmatis]|uniref:nucleotide sugar dehydrogenase n=1 Tax=Mycolicibacterium smegmatis TaxID=1772 RepID=UPI001CBE13CF|nr:nucleotide sugar dehydrogenase [Mycolicibacterium smegmatis]MDF1901728.1 nucleotide sugar dehydrogenase [Mycolicibacterium smegmatis]MDF1908072.1 nucleotide sugar dehydrogenase [Mycolicibacterium smegmatis]MDF1920584.1 nucleotide sugar dehydrogenase [Mycolicibacterium smegmatis]MDF1926547.1 nucleotide sugar dehydrogenase [Mycolicibacterium smegmatis]